MSVDGRKIRSVGLYHLSWWRVITEAIVQHQDRGIEDPDQAWILGELIAYLDHEKSGASGFQDMGEKWVKVRNGAANGALRAGDREAREVAERWDQRELRTFMLTLTRPIGTKRGKGEKSFVLETRHQAVDFYRRIVQDLRAWQPTAPKLPQEPEDVPATPTAEPPPFSAEDERELGEAVDTSDKHLAGLYGR